MRSALPHLSLRIQIVLLICLVAVPALALLLVSGLQRRAADSEVARGDAVTAARMVGDAYLEVVDTTDSLMRPITAVVSQRGSLDNVDPAECVGFLEAYLPSQPVYAAVHMARPSGEVHCGRTLPVPDLSFSEHAVFEEALTTTESVVGTYQAAPLTGRPVLPMAHSIPGPSGEVIGVLVFMIDVVSFDLENAIAALPEGSFATVVDANGTVLARHPELDGVVGQRVSDSATFEEIRRSGEGTTEATNGEGVESLLGYARLGREGAAFVIVGIPEGVAFADANAALRLNLALLAAVFVAGVAIAWLGTERVVTAPLRRVVRTASRLQGGDRDARVGRLHAPAELNELGSAFDEMVDALQERDAEILELNASLDQRVRERTSELENANKELESFSYTVSHDLRAPLRAINGFAELLRSKYEPELPDEARGFIARIQNGAVRMGSLIDDLLQFSRIARGDLVRRPVALDPLVRQLIEDLDAAPGATPVDWRVGELGTASADPGLLRQVFANLLENARKFSRKRPDPVVEVGRLERDGETVYFVRDNGVGFDAKDAAQIFGMFQRLHLQEDFEGTGIGLAIVERIVTRHGGRVWAESARGEGATLYFTLGTVG